MCHRAGWQPRSPDDGKRPAGTRPGMERVPFCIGIELMNRPLGRMERALRAIPFITSFFAHESFTWGTPRDAEPFTSSILVQESAFPMLRADEKTAPPAASPL